MKERRRQTRSAILPRISARAVFARLGLCALCLSFCLSSAQPAQAQCEPFVAPLVAAGVTTGVNTGLLTAQFSGLLAAMNTLATNGVNKMTKSLTDMEDDVVQKRMGQFWDDWLQALKDMTKQLNISNILQTEQIYTFYDTKGMNEAQQIVENAEDDAKQQYQPTAMGCQFDTAGRYNTDAIQNSKAMSSSMSSNFSDYGDNNQTTPAAQGTAKMTRSRWDIHASMFCDPKDNGGHAGCEGTSDPAFQNADKLPTKTLFGRYTLDMGDEKTRDAVDALVFNMTGYKVPDPMNPSTLETPSGREQRTENRAYIAKMDAIGALPFSIIGERTGGKAAPEVQAMRTGVPPCAGPGFEDCASDKPSQREIQQGEIEQLQSPTFYTDLDGNSATLSRKQVYLEAYNLSLLYTLITKMEKISSVYSIEAASLLQKTDHSRDGAASDVPVKAGP